MAESRGPLEGVMLTSSGLDMEERVRVGEEGEVVPPRDGRADQRHLSTGRPYSDAVFPPYSQLSLQIPNDIPKFRFIRTK